MQSFLDSLHSYPLLPSEPPSYLTCRATHAIMELLAEPPTAATMQVCGWGISVGEEKGRQDAQCPSTPCRQAWEGERGREGGRKGAQCPDCSLHA